MKIDLLPALNGDCVLVEYVPSHYILIDGGYVDTYKDYLLPKLKEISENGGAIDVIVGKQSLLDRLAYLFKNNYLCSRILILGQNEYT